MSESSTPRGGIPPRDPPVMTNQRTPSAPRGPAVVRRLFTVWSVFLLLAIASVGGSSAAGSPAGDGAVRGPAGAPPSGPAPRSGQAITFRRLGLDDGLSQSSIYCIVQDARGFMWFGTEDGLNRFDGYEIDVYRHDPDDPYSLSSNSVLYCERDQRDVVWFLTADATVHRYEPGTGRFIRYDLALDDPFEQAGRGILALHGDRLGRLWIGTYGSGLLRYDPEPDRFATYRHDPDDATSLGHRIVHQVYEDHDGTIWVGTEAGLNRYDEETDAFERYPYRDFPPGGYEYDPPVHDYDPAFQPDNAHALGSPAVTRILESQDGTLWVGTRYGGLNRLDRRTGRFASYPFDPAQEPDEPNTFSGNSVRGLFEDRLGDIWVTSAHWNLDETRTYARVGLERLDPDTDAITRFVADPDDPCSLPHDYVVRLHEDSHGALWLHTFAGGVEVYDRATGCFVHYGHDPDDPDSLSGDGITVFYDDEADGLWLGTNLNGVNLYDPTWSKFPSYRVTASGGERLSNTSIWRFASSPENIDPAGRLEALWVSTFAGLDYWDRRTDTFRFYEIDPRLPDITAYGILEDPARGALWLATNMGLERADLPADVSTAPVALHFTRVLTRSSASVGYVLDLYPDDEDHVWLARYRVGLVRFDLAREEIVATYRHDPEDPTSLADDRVTKILPAGDGRLWLLTVGGVDQFDPRTEHFTHYEQVLNEGEGEAGRAISLHEDDTGTVWVGTNGAGLKRMEPATGRVTATYTDRDGLPNNVVYAILPDEAGGLWLSTNLGLTRFDPVAQTFETYTADDGLQSNEFNQLAGLRAPDGELFFGGVSGITAFYPDEIGPNPYVPPVVITDIRLGPPQPRGATGRPAGADASAADAASRDLLEAPVHITEEIALSHRDRVLSFAFAALHYAMPERNQYAYQLDGFDEDWNYVGNRRFATYTNLPPGRYVFRVRGSNSDGVWNEEGASLTVRVAPPFWAAWWFRGLVAVVLLGAALAGYRLRVRAIRAHSRQLEREVATRTKELESLNAIAAVVSRSLDLDEMLDNALEETLKVMDIEAGGIYLLGEESGMLTLDVHTGFSPRFAAAIDRLALGEGFSGRVAQSGEPLLVKDVSSDPRLTRLMVQEEGLRSLAVVPLSTRGQVLGTLFVVTRGYRAFTDRDAELLMSVGRQIGVAVENARLYADTRRRLAQLSALQQTTTAVAGTLELDKLLQLIVDDAVGLLQAEGGILNLVDWDAMEDEVVAAGGVAADSVGQRSALSAGLSGWVTLHDQAVVSNDVEADERVDRSGLHQLEAKSGRRIRNTAVAPLRIKDRIVGTLVILDKQGGTVDFDQSDLSLLQAFANQAATAIENARLFDTEQRRAEQFRVISEVARGTTSILSIDDLLEEIVFLIQSSFGYDIVEIALVEGEDLVFKAGLDQGVESPVRGQRLRVGQEGITGKVAATGEAILVPDVSQETEYTRFSGLGTESRSELAVPIKTKGQTVGVLNVQSAELDAFDQSDAAVLHALADQAGTAIENARLFGAEQRRTEQFRVISEVGRSITMVLSLDSVLHQVAELIQRAFGYDHVGIATIEDGTAIYRVGAGKMWESDDFEFSPASLKVGEEGITGWVAASGEALLIPDVRQDPRYVWMRGSSTRSELAVPIKLKGEVIGVLDAQSDEVNAFDESDLSLLQSMADQAAIAIENARLYEQARRLAVVEERQRLARELHDSVTQALYGTTLYAEAAARQLADGQVDLVGEHLRDLRDTAQEALREMRLLIFELRPSILESEGLVPALRARLEAVEQRAGLAVELRVTGDRVLPPDVEEGFYRIAQEALNNALKHACAYRVRVSLHQGQKRAVLEIADDGRGFDPSTSVEGGGLGLDGMIERAAKMGGELVLDSAPGTGTRIRVEVAYG